MDAIIRFDIRLFYFLNTRLTSPALDVVMPFITNKYNFIFVVIAVAVLTVIFGDRKDKRVLLLLAFLVLSSDLACNVIKHSVKRIRPCGALEGVRLLTGCGGYSMPSGHATNIFAAMVFLSIRYKKFSPVFLAVAFAVSYSRVYVGVHYPLDVTAGALLGTSMALFFWQSEVRVLKYIKDKKGL